jgi:hypothetical protein
VLRGNVLELGEVADLETQMLMRRTELSVTTNVSAENETATFAKPLLGAGALVFCMFLVIVLST